RHAVCSFAAGPSHFFRGIRMRRALSTVFAALIALAWPTIVSAQIQYSYTLVAVTGGASTFNGLFAPSINSTGTVSFGATLTSGGQGIFSGNGGTVSPMAQTRTPFNSRNFPPGPLRRAL